MILEQNTSFDDIKKSDKLIVYHSCSVRDLRDRFSKNKDKNIHAGTLLQAMHRADFKINDECLYDKAYIHEIHLNLEGLCPKLTKDDGCNSNVLLEDSFKSKWNILCYKNVSEGYIRENNLSVIILNKDNITDILFHSEWNGEDLEKSLYKY